MKDTVGTLRENDRAYTPVLDPMAKGNKEFICMELTRVSLEAFNKLVAKLKELPEIQFSIKVGNIRVNDNYQF